MTDEEPRRFNILIETAGVLNYASCVNGIPIVQRLELINRLEEAVNDLAISLIASPPLIQPLTINVAHLGSDDRYVLEHVNLVADRGSRSTATEGRHD